MNMPDQDDTVSASIGLASINSLIEVDEHRCGHMGLMKFLAEKGRNLDVAVVGHFPFIPKLRDVARNVWVIEKRLGRVTLPRVRLKIFCQKPML